MVSNIVLFTAAFFLAVVGFTVGITWVAIRDEAHSPKALTSDEDDTAG